MFPQLRLERTSSRFGNDLRTKLENTSLSAHIIPQISYLKTRIFFPDSIIIVDIIVISDKLYSENDFYGVFFLTADGGVIYFYQKDEDLFMERISPPAVC